MKYVPALLMCALIFGKATLGASFDQLQSDASAAVSKQDYGKAIRIYQEAARVGKYEHVPAHGLIDNTLYQALAEIETGNLEEAQTLRQGVKDKSCDEHQRLILKNITNQLLARRYYFRGITDVASLPKSLDPNVAYDLMEFGIEREPADVIRSNILSQLSVVINRYGYNDQVLGVIVNASSTIHESTKDLYTVLGEKCPALKKDCGYNLEYAKIVGDRDIKIEISCLTQVIDASTVPAQKTDALTLRCNAYIIQHHFMLATQDATQCLAIAQANNLPDVAANAKDQLATIQRWKDVLAKDRVRRLQ